MNARYPCKKVLVPLDFSDDSRRACDYALAVARAAGAEVVLLTVVEETFPYPELFAWDNPNEEFYKTMRQRALAHMEELVRARGGELAIERVVVRGKPREEIGSVASDVGADLIVLARHGSGGLRCAFMGSTSEAVLRTAPCPVVVLPAPADA